MKSWFKHYNNAHSKKTILELEAKFGIHKGYAMYFKLIEYCHALWDGTEDYTFSINRNILKTSLRCKEDILRIFLEYLENQQQIRIVNYGFIIRMKFPKLLEIQDKDSKYNRKRIVTNDRKTTLDKEEDKEEDKEDIYSRNFEETLSYWNSLKIVIHSVKSKVVDNAKRKYKLKRKFYSHSDILQAITNYSKIYHDNDSFFKYRWSLDEFLGRENANKFFPDVFHNENFYKTDLKNKSQFKGVRW